MEKPRSVRLEFAVMVKVMCPVGGKGTHTHTFTHRGPMANDSGLLVSREERAMVNLKEEIDGTVCVSIRLNVMSSAEVSFILLSICFFFCISGALKLQQVSGLWM